MARAQWPLKHGRPAIEIILTLALDGAKVPRTLLADTGAGSSQSVFEMLLDENDCILCGGRPAKLVPLGGAYSGTFPRYRMRVEIPQLNFANDVFVVGVPDPPKHLDGIACFRFLNRFTYGNFGNAGEFGLEI
jgi:hypothetical protein